MARKKNEDSSDESLGAALFWIVVAFLGVATTRVGGPLFYLALGALLILALFPLITLFKMILSLNSPSEAARPVASTGFIFGVALRFLFGWMKPIIESFFDFFFKSSQQRAKTKNATYSKQPTSSNQPTNGPSSPVSLRQILDPENVGFKEPFLMREETSQVNAENWLISLFVSLPIDLAAIVAICRWGGKLTEGYGVGAKLSFFFFSVVFIAVLSMTLVRVFIKGMKLLRDARTLFPDPILYWRFWGEEEGDDAEKGEESETDEDPDYHEIVVTRYVQKDDDFGIINRTARVVVPETIEGVPVTRIADSAFEDSAYLGEVVLSDSVTTIGARAFAKCPRLYKVTLSDSVTSIGADAFSKQISLVVPSGSYAEEWAQKNVASMKIVPSKSNSTAASSSRNSSNAPGASSTPAPTPAPTPAGRCWGSFYWIERGENATITGMASTQIAKLKIPSKVAGRDVVEIGARAFQGGAFQTVTFPDELKTIGFCAFEGCANLKRVDLPRRLETVGSNAFQACRRLTKVSFPNGIEKIEDAAFADCDSLTSLHLPSSLQHIGTAPFSEQTALTVIAGSYAERWAANQTVCRYRAMGSPGRATGASTRNPGFALARTPTPSPSTGNADANSNANVFYVPKGYKNSRYDEVGEAVFKGDLSITEAAIPEGIERVENMAFYECFNLCRVILPDSLRAIGAGAFAECPRLKEIVIPNGVTRIGRKAFGKETTLVVAPYSYAQRWASENGINTRVIDWQQRLQEVQILRGARKAKVNA